MHCQIPTLDEARTSGNYQLYTSNKPMKKSPVWRKIRDIKNYIVKSNKNESEIVTHHKQRKWPTSWTERKINNISLVTKNRNFRVRHFLSARTWTLKWYGLLHVVQWANANPSCRKRYNDITALINNRKTTIILLNIQVYYMSSYE